MVYRGERRLSNLVTIGISEVIGYALGRPLFYRCDHLVFILQSQLCKFVSPTKKSL